MESLVGRTKVRLLLILGLGSLSLLGLFVYSLTVGSVPIGWTDALDAFVKAVMSGGEVISVQEKIVYLVRFPRFLAAVGVGVGLAIAGVVMQAVVRNPLVDPYITGVSSGASFGATSFLMLGFLSGSFAVYALPISAFIGAAVAFFLTIGLSEAAGGRPITFVLSGVIVGFAFSSVTNILVVKNPDHLKGVLFWMFGNLTAPDLTQCSIILLTVGVIGAVVLVYARELNVILLGEEQGSQLGVDVRKVKLMMMVLSSLLTAVCVAFTGVIAFLGLIVPHMARIIVGGDHRLLLPASMIIGANFLVAADIFTRYVGELPIGAVISLVGAPFFGYLLVSRGKDYVN
ncbi:MAG: iron ABC transporter permease [Methanomassiliicoccales archaeon]|nr:MAG: iron ABC transporter permease [Methanomassiliicoccales archaeon]